MFYLQSVAHSSVHSPTLGSGSSMCMGALGSPTSTTCPPFLRHGHMLLMTLDAPLISARRPTPSPPVSVSTVCASTSTSVPLAHSRDTCMTHDVVTYHYSALPSRTNYLISSSCARITIISPPSVDIAYLVRWDFYNETNLSIDCFT